MKNEIFCIILAGGRGTRFWPVSTRAHPKQFISLTGEKTLFQKTVERANSICGMSRIFVVTGREHADTVKKSAPGIPEENILLEPSGKNTTACIGWAAAVLASRKMADGIMVVMPSDHVVDSIEGFSKTIFRATNAALKGWLTAIGIGPRYASTGYGYLQQGEEISEKIWRVKSFREKPDRVTAERYLEEGGFFWNAGIFIWSAGRILEEIEQYQPGLFNGLARLGETVAPDEDMYNSLESVSIDYGVMEKAGRVAMVCADFTWDDVGNWPSVRRVRTDQGDIHAVDSDNYTIWDKDGRLTVLLGVNGLSVVRTDRVTLIMSDEYSQKLREVVADLEKKRPDLF